MAEEANAPKSSMLNRIRAASWGRTAVGYLGTGFVLFAFAADAVNEPDAGITGMLLFVWLTAGYFIPAFVAWKRRHHQSMAIAALNLFAGWTVVGWIASLIWSLTAVRDPAGEAS